MSATVLTLQVVDFRGSVVNGATVRWCKKGHEWPAATADENGCARLGPFEAHLPHLILVEAPGFAPTVVRPRHLGSARDTDLGRIVLAPGPRLRARLAGPGRTVGAAIRAFVQTEESVLAQTVKTVGPPRDCEHQDGVLSSPPLAPGGVELVVLEGDRVAAIHWAEVPAAFDGDVDLGELRIEPERWIKGRVVDEDGRPLPEVEVRTGSRHGRGTKTDAAGEFRLILDCDAGQELRLEAPGRGRLSVPIPEKDDLPATIVLPLIRRIVGRVVDAESGAPLPVEDVSLCRLVSMGGLPPLAVG